MHGSIALLVHYTSLPFGTLWACIMDKQGYLHAVPQVVGTKNKIKKKKGVTKMFKVIKNDYEEVIIGKGKEMLWLYNKLLQKENVGAVVTDADYSNINKNRMYGIYLKWIHDYDYEMILLNRDNILDTVNYIVNKEVKEDELFNE